MLESNVMIEEFGKVVLSMFVNNLSETLHMLLYT